jgi:hypothetical protein
MIIYQIFWKSWLYIKIYYLKILRTNGQMNEYNTQIDNLEHTLILGQI